MPKKLPPLPAYGSLKLHKTLSAPTLLEQARQAFVDVPEHRNKKPAYLLEDVLMSGLAMFSLKRRHNLNTLYGVSKVPSDSQMRSYTFRRSLMP